jgi:hypothetical protein
MPILIWVPLKAEPRIWGHKRGYLKNTVREWQQRREMAGKVHINERFI